MPWIRSMSQRCLISLCSSTLSYPRSSVPGSCSALEIEYASSEQTQALILGEVQRPPSSPPSASLLFIPIHSSQLASTLLYHLLVSLSCRRPTTHASFTTFIPTLASLFPLLKMQFSIATVALFLTVAFAAPIAQTSTSSLLS